MSVLLAALPSALLGGAAERQRDLARADAAIRAPLALCRRVGFVQLAGGAGASTTAAAVTDLIAARRGGVLAVDAAAGPRSLRWHLRQGTTAPTPPDPDRERPRTRAEALSSLPRTPSGAAVLDVHGDDDLAVPEHAWAEQVAPLTRFCSVVCTDWGLRGAGADLGAAAAASSTVCLVTRADRAAVERALSAASALQALPHRPSCLVVAVDVGRTGARLPRGFGAGQPVPVLRIPFEPVRRGPDPVDGSACGPATRTALIRLAAAVMAETGAAR